MKGTLRYANPAVTVTLLDGTERISELPKWCDDVTFFNLAMLITIIIITFLDLNFHNMCSNFEQLYKQMATLNSINIGMQDM